MSWISIETASRTAHWLHRVWFALHFRFFVFVCVGQNIYCIYDKNLNFANRKTRKNNNNRTTTSLRYWKSSIIQIIIIIVAHTKRVIYAVRTKLNMRNSFFVVEMCVFVFMLVLVCVCVNYQNSLSLILANGISKNFHHSV